MGGLQVIGRRVAKMAHARPSGETVRELAARYIQAVSDFGAASTRKTHARARALIDGAVDALTKIQPLDDHPAPGEIADWLAALNATGRYSSATLATYRICISAWYTNGDASGWSHGNPADGKHVCFRFVGARSKQLPVAMPAPAVVSEALAQLQPRELAYFETMRMCGLRPAEALGLVGWGDLCDFAIVEGVKAIRVRRQRPTTHATNENPWACLPYLKRHADARCIPIPDELWKILDPLLREGPPTVRTGLGGGGRATVPFIFPFKTNALNKLHKKLQAAGLMQKGQGGYTFRHFFAGEGIETGVDPIAMQALLGHAYLNTTQGYYERAGANLAARPAQLHRKVTPILDDVPKSGAPPETGKTQPVSVNSQAGSNSVERPCGSHRDLNLAVNPPSGESNVSSTVAQGKT